MGHPSNSSSQNSVRAGSEQVQTSVGLYPVRYSDPLVQLGSQELSPADQCLTGAQLIAHTGLRQWYRSG